MSTLLWLALALAAPPRPVLSQAIQDSRCYLMSGGAVESFFISEDTPVGSIIGTLSVNGDPDEQSGNISLRLQERGAAVAILPGSKNVSLLRALDREEVLAPSSVYVNVRCDRRHTTDPSFVIPVSIRVWDVNDNAPAWSGAPYRARVSELTAVGARVLTAAAHDPDQAGPHATVHYSVLPGPGAEYIGFLNELDSTIVVKKPLDYETVRNMTVRLRAADGGSPPRYNDTTLQLEVLDADDQNPRFTSEHYVVVLPDTLLPGTELETTPSPISAADQDVGINAPLHYSVSSDGPTSVHINRDTGQLAAAEQLLHENLPLTLVVKATQVDNADRYALATVSIRRRTSRGAPAPVSLPPGSTGAPVQSAVQTRVKFSKKEYTARVPEDAAPGTLLLTLHTQPPRMAHDPALQFYVSERGFLDRFAINSAGEVLLRAALDYETDRAYFYRVMVTDGNTNDTASLNITVENVNEWEPRFRYPQYEFLADVTADSGAGSGAGSGLVRVGKLDVHDGDAEDDVTLTLRGLHAHMFYVNKAGELFLRSDAMSALNSSVLHVVVTALDSGSPPRQTSVPVAVHVSGADADAGAGAGRDARTRSASVLLTFVVALVLLAAAVLGLLTYIYVHRRGSGVGKNKSTAPSEKASSRAGAETGAGAGAGAGGSLQSVSAGASTILDSSSSLDTHTHAHDNNRQSHRPSSKSKVAPAPPVLPTAAVVGPGAVSPTLMSDHLGGAGGRSGVAWPSATIPARVKKLSWDERLAGTAEEESRGDRDVTEATNPTMAEHMNLTVYF